jgi:hypothetical protein
LRIAALEEALDDALLEQPLQARFGSQFGQVANCALRKGGSRAACAADTRRLSPPSRALPHVDTHMRESKAQWRIRTADQRIKS